jgi:cytoskeletal protein CcmA (bactofilin family)
VSNGNGQLTIQHGTVLRGDIRNCRQLDVGGLVEGDVAAENVTIHEGGRIAGNLRADQIAVHGMLEGDVTVRGLLSIASSGTVEGDIKYGQLSIEAGGNLIADVRNIPPRLAGDYCIEVQKGGVGKITREDLQAIDPDDPAENLEFTVSHPTRGYIALSSAPDQPVGNFTQADINRGAVMFVHDGSEYSRASFDVVCADAKGGTSGGPQTVRVEIQG